MFEKNVEYHKVQSVDTVKLFTYTDSTYSASGMTINEAIAPQSDTIPQTEKTSSYNFNLARHLFTSNYNNTSFFSIKNNYSSQKNYVLQENSRLLSLPVRTYGKRIKEGTFSLTDTSTGSISIIDDGNGNLIDSGISTNTLVSDSSLIGWFSFDDGYEKKAKYSNKNLFISDDSSYYLNSIKLSNATFSQGKNGTGYKLNLGTETSGYLTHYDMMRFDKNDFTVSFWVNIPPTQSNNITTSNTILCKRNTATTSYPFEISVYNTSSADYNGRILIQRKAYKDEMELNEISFSSSLQLNDGNSHHVCLVNSSGSLKLYIDGTLNNSMYDYHGRFNASNTCNIFVGARGGNSNTSVNSDTYFSGSIDELRFYSSEVSVANLYNDVYNTNVIGSIFYEKGIILFNNLSGSYANILKGTSANGFTFSYRAVSQITEHEICVRKDPNEFNFSMNPSIRLNGSSTLINQLTSSVSNNTFVPYITTIGLYDDKNRLLAVGKIKEPIKSIKDIMLSFTIRLDM